MQDKNPAGAGERATLRDVINYQPAAYLTDQEISLIQNTFRDNQALVNVIRKIFIPSIMDGNLPIEEVSSDVFSNHNWAAMPADEAKILVVARQDAIKFIIGGLIKLQVIANQKVEDAMELALRRSKDSSQ